MNGRMREVPQGCVGRTGAGDDGTALVSDGEGVGVERGNATPVAKLAYGNEGAGGQVRRMWAARAARGRSRRLSLAVWLE